MLYNRLTEDERERAVYIDPTNAAAAAEMLRGVPERMEEHADALAEAEAELKTAKSDHESELDLAHTDLNDAEKYASDLAIELAGANDLVALRDKEIGYLNVARHDAITHTKEVMLEIVTANKKLTAVNKQLATANARIAELTCAEDLV